VITFFLHNVKSSEEEEEKKWKKVREKKFKR
jgi:hypothetical protein